MMSPLNPFFESIVLGHNSFFGVDHLSAARGQERAQYFSDPKRILGIIEAGFDEGARGLMMSTHERAAWVCELLNKHPKLKTELSIYPLLPYAQKYVTAANEKGMLNVILDVLSTASTREKLSLFMDGVKTVVSKDFTAILSGLIRVELLPFKGLKVPAVFLHDVFTDLILALDLKGVVSFYYEEMEKEYGAKAAFATKNLPLFLDKFSKWGFSSPLVMPHFNKVGFSMNPDRQSCEVALSKFPCHVMAMSTLASGYLKPAEAYSYLGQFPSIESVVVGASTREHIRETLTEIKANFRRFS